MKKTITKEFKFDSAHRLYNPKLTDDENKKIFGKCYNLHGHTYHMFVTVSGKETNGMVVNFVDLKNIVNEYVVDKFDHQFLNETSELKNIITTCENQINVIWKLLDKPLKQKKITLEEIKLYETETSYATLTRK
jgi:6-pyruvoyltetrahydropterin/6-carboxytetrahydropterin synthase